MTEREKFEAWATEEGWRNFTRINEGYRVDHLDDAWQTWQASHRAALEEVQSALSAERDMCSGSLDPYISSEYAARLDAKIDAIDGCIDAIRALSQKDPQ